MKKIFSFLSYHNVVPLAGIALALGATATFAATATGVLPPLSFSQGSAAASSPPDASYLVNADLDAYAPTAQVTGVTEDADNYYVSYALSTVALVGNAWQSAVEAETLTISKDALGAYRDLGLYVAGLLEQRTAQELAYLKRAQEVAQESAWGESSGPQVASAYLELVGKTLNPDSAAIPGYTPVVENPIPNIPAAPALTPPAIEDSQSAAPSDTPAASSTPQVAPTDATSTGETSVPTSTAATSAPTSTDDADASSTPQVAPTDATSTHDTADASSTAMNSAQNLPQQSATSSDNGVDATSTDPQ